ncbi:MAG: hypothetical protein H6818_20890 [Phycisphaerales bacterium]|nr:hypothetical protein [Phycisphaerales bacterium]MCB9862248.1 hypothetical protein [Phycisphaerales bacterium]
MSILLTIDEQYREKLAAAGLDSFDALMHADVGEVVTRRDGRETRRVVLGDGDNATTVYIKRCFSIGPKHSFWPRLLLRPCHTPPIKEAHAIAMCRAAGIPTVDVIASGESRLMGIPRAGFVVMTAAPMEWTLNDWLTIGYERPRELADHERVALMRAVGALLSQFAIADIHWPDCKAKHIHAAPAANGAWRLLVIDLERSRRIEGTGGDFTSHHAAISGLFPSVTPSTLRHEDLIAFWTAAFPYMDAVGKAKAVDRETTDSMSSFGSEANPRLDDAFAHPNRLPLVKAGGMRVDPRYIDLMRDAALSTYDDVMGTGVGASMNKPGLASYRERIRLTLGEGDAAETVYLKRYTRPPLKEQFRRMWEFKFRRGSAEREMHFIRHLGMLGISTMRRIAFGSRMRGWFEQSGFGITREVAGESLEKLVERWSSDPATVPGPADRRDIIEQLAKVIFRLHTNGLFHRDLYLCHIFMSRRDDGGIVLSLIDLGRMIRSTWRRERWRIKDLAALAYSSPSPLVTRADRIRFLYHYTRLEARGNRASARKRTLEIIALIENRVTRMARHDVNRKRRLENR